MTLELTAEERTGLSSNAKTLVAWLEAYEGGDTAGADRLFSELEISAHALMAIKETRGADWIRSRNLRTHLADEKYGPGWLDRTEEEEFARERAAGRR